MKRRNVVLVSALSVTELVALSCISVDCRPSPVAHLRSTPFEGRIAREVHRSRIFVKLQRVQTGLLLVHVALPI